MFSVQDQVVIVTGAVGRLGSAIARCFQQHGARTVLVDREAQRLRDAYPDLHAAPQHLLVGGIDLTAPAGAAAVATRALERFGQVDALINTVGAFRGGKPVHEDDPANWEFLFDVNVRTALHACRAVIPTMLRQRRGRIVNVASQAALKGVAGLAPYCAAKAAVVRLTESLAAEVRHAGISVNCVLPGTLDTPENRRAQPDADTSAWVAPAAVAGVIAFLTSEAADVLHGTAIPIG